MPDFVVFVAVVLHYVVHFSVPCSISAIGPRNILGNQNQSGQLNNLQKRPTVTGSFGG